LYQHFRPSISRQDHQPDCEFGELRQSIASADEAATQQQTSTVAAISFMTGFENPTRKSLTSTRQYSKSIIATHSGQNNPGWVPGNVDVIEMASNPHVSN